ncbi:Glyoxylate/hydroxypyruvate reductase B [Candidatus Methanoperedenaceae archaeon GB50]|nr:Glyoxylate/hydroxypyruvate reductase B [Candidatus Methanoperedenaceae archaeon GB50]CAD7777979.1 MAG: Glyoxylate/hydroxypyruvate reductase B [Candidatus Methanoperedenaceae archaeon GB50]
MELKVLVSDPIADEGLEILRKEFLVDVATELSHDELKRKIPGYDALLVRSQTKVTGDIIEAGERLKIIGRAGVGVDNIDVAAATRKGVIVVNAPEGNTISAAEHTIAMILAVSRKIPEAHASLVGRRWDRKKFMGVELRGKTLGIVGIGRVGAEVAKRAIGFEMDLLAYDPFISSERASELGVKLTSLDEVISKSDYITVHTPLTKDTVNLIDAEEFEKMKPTAYIINCARGGIINEDALYNALKSGRVAGAALDVFVEEPPLSSPLLDLKNIVVTPHLGASTEEAQVKVAVTVAEEIKNALNGRPVKNAINMPYVRHELMTILTPYIQLAEKLGRIGSQLVSGTYSSVTIQYHGEIAEKEVETVTIAAMKGLLENVFGEGVNYVNAPVVARERGIKITESKSETMEYYPNVISLIIEHDNTTRMVSGTVVGGEDRIVQIDDYHLDIAPTRNMILAVHEDRPNIIGPCCVVLGRHNINIAGMQVGRIRQGSDALMILNIDTPITDEILEEIRSVSGIKSAQQITL